VARDDGMAIGHWRPVTPCDVAACLLARAAVTCARPENVPNRVALAAVVHHSIE
jgi:hypothetical protein